MKSTCIRLSYKAASISNAVIVALLVFTALPGASAEDPTRFLSVTNWYATFATSLNENGTFEYTENDQLCTATWHFVHEITVSCQLSIDPSSVGHPYFRQFNWKMNDSFSIHVNDTYDRTCIDPDSGSSSYNGYRIRDLGLAPTNFLVLIDTTNQVYYIAYPPGARGSIPVTSEILYDDLTIPGNIGVQWTPDEFSSNSLPSAGMVLQGQKSFFMRDWYLALSGASADFTAGDPRFGGTSPLRPSLLTAQVNVSWTLTPVREELELVIESDRYEEWLPLGNVKDWRQPGDILFLTAVLQQKNGQPALSRATTIKFQLMEVSTEKGVCMNRPIEQFANADPDLRFQGPINLSPIVDIDLEIENDGMTAVTPDGQYDIVEAGISSFDFGAYGAVKVTALVNGKEIVGYWQNDPAKQPKPLLLPKRNPGSWIADQWKQDNEVDALEDTDDEETVPAGDGHNGDGLSLYEEYRGFSQNLKHMRANPRKKDFFLADNIGNADSTAGIALFKAQSGLEVHSKMRSEEFNVSLASGGYSSFLNFNHSGGSRHLVDQHGINILEKRVSDGVSSADGPSQGGTPAFYERVFIDRSQYGWQEIPASPRGRILTFEGATTVAHELAHTCAVWHHGNSDRREVPWTLQGFEVYEFTQEVEPRFENNTDGAVATLRLLERAGTNTMSVWIGMPQGEHSGDPDCFMRYTSSRAYPSRSDTHVRYVVNEAEGIHLCTDSAGKGINDSNRTTPQPRYGDAMTGRGNCKGQICVNDRYNRHGTHMR